MIWKDRVPRSRPRAGKRGAGGPPAAGTAGDRRGEDDPGTKRPYGAWQPGRQSDENAGWAIVSYLIAGMSVYGGIGWLVGHWTGLTAVLFPVGMLVGLVLAIVLVIFRYGRS